MPLGHGSILKMELVKMELVCGSVIPNTPSLALLT